MVEGKFITDRIRTENSRKLRSKVFCDRLHAEHTARFIELNGVIFPHPAFRILPVRAELRGGGRKAGTAHGAIKRSFGNDLVERVPIEGNVLPLQAGIHRLDPEGVIQRERMGNVQIAFQRVAAILFQKFGNMCPVLWRFALLQKIRQVCVSKGPKFRVPDIFLRGRFQIFVLLTMEFQPDGILVQKEILHPQRSFPSRIGTIPV